MVDYRTKTCILTHAPRACECGTRSVEHFSKHLPQLQTSCLLEAASRPVWMTEALHHSEKYKYKLAII